MSFRIARRTAVVVSRRSHLEGLESRRLLSGVAPAAVSDTFTVAEDTSLLVSAGENKLTLTGNTALYNGSGTFTDAIGTTTGEESSPRSVVAMTWSRTSGSGPDNYFHLYLYSGSEAPLAVG